MKGFYALLIGLFMVSTSVVAQTPVFTFECVCAQLTGDTCDLCPINTALYSRSFSGLLIYRNVNGTPVPYKWIDEPYTIRRLKNNSVQFIEQIPSPDQVTIALFQTQFSTMQGFVDSTFCQCNGGGPTYVAGPGIVISNDSIIAIDTSFTNELQHIDTLSIVGGNLLISLSNDGLPASSVMLPVPDGSETKVTAGTGISVTGLGTIVSPYVVTNTGDLSITNEIQNLSLTGQSLGISGGGTGVTLPVINVSAGTGISVSALSGNYTVTNTGDLSTTNEIQTISASGAGPTSYNFDLNLSGGSVTLAEGTSIDLTRSGNTVTINNTGDLSITNEIQNLSLSGQSLGISGGGTGVTLPVVGITAGTNISVTSLAGVYTINNTGAAPLSGVVNQFAYFGTTTTITTEAGSGANAATWDPVCNCFGVSIASPQDKIHIDGNVVNGGGITINTPGNAKYRIGTLGTSIANWGGQFINMKFDQSAGNWNLDDVSLNAGFFKLDVRTGSFGDEIAFYRLVAGSNPRPDASVLGMLHMKLATGNIGVKTNSPNKDLEVNGEMRVNDLVNGTPTLVVGANASGDLSVLALSGMSVTGGTLTAADGSVTNEIQNLSLTGQSLGISGGGTGVTLPVINVLSGTGISVGSSSGAFTITNTGDLSTTNEVQTISASGAGPTSYDVGLNLSGGSVTFAEGSGIDLTRSGNTITIASTGITSATGYINGGNSFGANATIGLNDNFRWDFETNNIVRGGINSGGTWWVGLTPMTTAQLNVSTLGSTNIGILVSGGGSLVGPNFYQATGSGTGSTATVLSGVISMTSGNVEAIMKNTTTGGTNGGALFTVNVTSAATTNDPFYHWEIDGVTEWSMGIDNDDVDNMKLHRFGRPSDNNGVGTIEWGYNGTSIGMAINKTGIGITTNGFYGLDVQGKARTDMFVNNSNVTIGTYALGTATGTGATIDNTVTEFWGNGGRLKFTTGTLPTANGTICTITMDANWFFGGECAPIIQARTTNGALLGYSGTYNVATRVITFTLAGTFLASTVYEFNIDITGM